MGIDYSKQSLLSMEFLDETGAFYLSRRYQFFRTEEKDLKKIYGTNYLDMRLNSPSHNFHANKRGEDYIFDPTKSNIVQNWYYMRINVYDTITQYTLPPGTVYSENDRTVTIFQKEKWSTSLTGAIIFGFYHKLTSTHESVSAGGNKHDSYFFFKAGSSGELCPSSSIQSLNSNLGLEWVYVKVMRDMWSTEYSLHFRTNLMGNDCIVKNTDFGDNGYDGGNGIFQLGESKSFISGKPNIFYYYIQNTKIGSGGDIFIETDTRDCLTFIERGAGYFSNKYAVFECPVGKVRVLDECKDPPGTANGCVHNGTPCTLCQMNYALNSGSGTCHQCPANCDSCVYSTTLGAAECKICNERFTLDSGNCRACLTTEVWDSKSLNCYPATDLSLQSGYIYNGLTTPGSPFPNNTYLVIEAKYTVGPTGTYEQEQVRIFVDGVRKDCFQNLTSPLFSYTDNSYTFFITIDDALKFETLHFEFDWDISSPDEVVTVDYVKAYANTYDLTQDCLIINADGTCSLCNKYKIVYKDKDGNCVSNNINIFFKALDFSKRWNLFDTCSTDGSVKYCWGKNGGAAECTSNNWLLVNGYCPACDSSCQGCKSDDPVTALNHLYNCISCPPGSTGLKVIASNNTKRCVPCESPGCTSCPLDYQVCDNCGSGYEKINGKCWKICSEKNTFNSSQSECSKCHSQCDGCLKEGLNGCLKCSPGFLKSETNCTDSSKGFCCYSCPENCLDCSYNGICSS